LFSPGALGVTSVTAKADFVVVGLLIASLALYEVWMTHENFTDQT
jgi:hypothetical protein